MAVAGRMQLLCHLLLVATLIIDGDVVAARPFSPSTLQTQQQVMHGQASGLARSEEGGPAAAAGRWSPTTTLKELQSGRGRRLVGSRAPTCTYNECRGCRHRCSAHGVPVDASDPMNSVYHYKCFCHF